MLKKINGREDTTNAVVAVRDAKFPEPFYDALQFATPARGTWNIIHMTMQVPETHQIHFCGLGCLRGTILTAAEAQGLGKFSTVVIEEHELYDGSMEETIINGVEDIISRLPKMPKGFFLYPSCVHHIMGLDAEAVKDELQRRHPETRFILCWMDPMRRRTTLTPEQRTRRQNYALLPRVPLTRSSVNIIGSNLLIQDDCELARLVAASGATLRQLTAAQTFEEYEKMGESFLSIAYDPCADRAIEFMRDEYGQETLYLPASFVYDDIIANLHRLSDALGLPQRDYTEEIAACEAAFAAAKEKIGDRPIAIDYGAVFCPWSLAQALLTHGFNVQRVYVDVINNDDKPHFLWVKEHYPDLLVYSVRNAKVRVMSRDAEEFLCIGQKCAFQTGSHHFVNMAENGGLYDFAGIKTLLGWLVDAAETEKDPRDVIRVKGWRYTPCQ